jgi:hypothetical protein
MTKKGNQACKEAWRLQKDWLHGRLPNQQADAVAQEASALALAPPAPAPQADQSQVNNAPAPAAPAPHANNAPALQPQADANNAPAVLQPQANHVPESGWTRVARRMCTIL